MAENISLGQTSSQYSKEDYKKLSWDKYEEILEFLFLKIKNFLKENNLKVNCVVPILRGGNFAGTYLAYKLGIVKIIPVQYKYFFKQEKEEKIAELRKIFGLPKDLNLGDKPVILVTENCHCFGTTAQIAIDEIKEQFPNSFVIYVADTVDYTYKNIKGADIAFYGILTNDTKTLTSEECKNLGVDETTTLFPWEDLEEEWDIVQCKQTSYQDLDSALNNSELKKEIKF
ncbi:MAG: phosphoribosyltransferase [Candidatus Gracilibacteria bacterium]|nr:phosphoribosyltransferase [Candidatus Gracilibacteria bacterium]MDD3119892.1 phosphoribosyltransferase [Candidatus Gracilibacteria bacterium]MDD4530063.1 phosphoribosyltransferase [Candidatus Gracilibacteria bacterium]